MIPFFFVKHMQLFSGDKIYSLTNNYFNGAGTFFHVIKYNSRNRQRNLLGDIVFPLDDLWFGS